MRKVLLLSSAFCAFGTFANAVELDLGNLDDHALCLVLGPSFRDAADYPNHAIQAKKRGLKPDDCSPVASEERSPDTKSGRPTFVAVLSGVAQVVDGDGLLFGGVEIRLQGIAAPELSERGGHRSKNSLASLASEQFVVCHLDGTVAGSSRRPVGVCYAAGEELGHIQVRTGHARDCPRYSSFRYQVAERQAAEEGADIRDWYELPSYCDVD